MRDLGFSDAFTECHPGLGVMCCAACVRGAEAQRLSLCGDYCAPHKALMCKLDAVTTECAELRLKAAQLNSTMHEASNLAQIRINNDDWSLIRAGLKSVILSLGGSEWGSVRNDDTVVLGGYTTCDLVFQAKVRKTSWYCRNEKTVHDYLRWILETEGLARTLPRALTIEDGINVCQRTWSLLEITKYGLHAIYLHVPEQRKGPAFCGAHKPAFCGAHKPSFCGAHKIESARVKH